MTLEGIESMYMTLNMSIRTTQSCDYVRNQTTSITLFFHKCECYFNTISMVLNGHYNEKSNK